MRRSRTASAICAVALVFALGACTGDDDDDDDAATDTTEEATDDTDAPDDAEAGGGAASGETLAAVQEAGEVRCGSRDDLPGFATLDPAGEHVGFDVDFCRAIAAAVLGDATAAVSVDVETDDRFTALQSGEIDVLVRNTTWTAQRDGAEGATFLHTNFYDGQGMMVAADSGITALTDLSGQVVCVAGGTTTEGNVATEFAAPGARAARSAVVRRCGIVASRVPRRPVRRLVVGPQPAHGLALRLSRRTGHARDPARRLLQGTALARGA